MTIDKYALCPCGSGKKIKFCKCKESVSELDRVMKMVEGGQLVPALDHLSKVLNDHPDAAWALAIRGRLLLDLREYDALGENADRFIRLQPSNPLALTQRAASRIFHDDIQGATESLLEALTESGRDVDSFVLDVASVLAYSLAQRGILFTAREYGTLAMMAQNYEGGQSAVSVLRQLNTSPQVNHLMKVTPEILPRPSEADWGERYDEAWTLLHNNKITLAESKLQSLRRTVPDEPAILSGLLNCAIWQGDVESQQELLKHLAACDSLEFEQRARYLAQSALVDPAQEAIAVPTLKLEAEIEKADEAEMALTSSARFISLPSDMLSRMVRSEEEVPPRAAFQLLDRDKPESLDDFPPVEDFPEYIALVLVYGKQTDRSARIEAMEVRKANADQVRETLQAALPETTWSDEETHPIPLLEASQPSFPALRIKNAPSDLDQLQQALINTRVPAAITSMKLPLLGDASLHDLRDDESKKLERTAVMRIVENYDVLVSSGEEPVRKIYEQAGLEPLPPIVADSNEVERIDNVDMGRVDVSKLDSESLVYLLQRAQQISCSPAMERCAKRLLEIELSEEQLPMRMLAYVTLLNTTVSSVKSLKILEEAKAFGEKHNIPIANLLLSELGLRLNIGDSEGFQSATQAIISRYGNDPEVMARLQQTLISYGLIRPDGTPQTGGPPPGAGQPAGPPPAAEESPGKLWTPDSGSPSSSPSQGGGGKLWVPGMD